MPAIMLFPMAMPTIPFTMVMLTMDMAMLTMATTRGLLMLRLLMATLPMVITDIMPTLMPITDMAMLTMATTRDLLMLRMPMATPPMATLTIMPTPTATPTTDIIINLLKTVKG